jgi:hypothetical protein
VVSAFCAAVRIQFIIATAANKGVRSLGTTELLETSFALIVDKCISAWL